MSPLADADRWNERYQASRRYSFERPRPFLIQQAALLPGGGLALDAAMGLGGNSEFLLSRGLRVIGLDISEVAVRKACRRLPGLAAAVVDLTRIRLPHDFFDVIVNFFYLERELWRQYQQALKPGGLLVYETLTVDMLEMQPEIEREYLLEKGELARAFEDMEILQYREGWDEGEAGHRRATAALVARKGEKTRKSIDKTVGK
jgi:tellurite methyltransferase